MSLCHYTVPILRTFGAITVPNVLRRFGAKKVEIGCGVPVPKFGALPMSMSNKRMAPPRAVVFWCLAPKWAVDGTKYFSLGCILKEKKTLLYSASNLKM